MSASALFARTIVAAAAAALIDSVRAKVGFIVGSKLDEGFASCQPIFANGMSGAVGTPA